MEKIDKQNELAKFIVDKCDELGFESPEEMVEVIGGATLTILGNLGEHLGVSFDDMRKEYVRGLSEAK